MRRKTLIFLWLFVIIFVVAEVPRLHFPVAGSVGDSLSVDSAKVDSVRKDSGAVKKLAQKGVSLQSDSLKGDSMALKNDTSLMDSLQKAIWLHNKVIDDSLRADSINRTRKNGIDAPVDYTAEDSMVYEGDTKVAHLFGKSHVKYQNMNLESDKIMMSMDSSLVYAMGSADSTGTKYGTPVFKMGDTTYETDTMSFNFKTKKGLISNVYTEQEDGYMTSEKSKRDANGDMFLYHGRYTTCDLPHPDFYFAMSRAKVRPGKDVVFGPTYLVVADVPLPFAIPYGFFPFTKSYSSGFIMPTYGDETSRGFYLRDGGYYFAISDKMDLKLTGDIYTKGSWAIRGLTNYKKRYKFSGTFSFDYQSTKTGDKNMPDYTKETSFQVRWQHRQDPKANPFNTLTASVNYSSTSYEQQNLSALYNPQTLAQSTRTSSVNWGVTFSNIGLTVNSTFSVQQNKRDSTINLQLPEVSWSLARLYPFRRKKMVGEERWYEKIALEYSGEMRNSINTKEDKLMKSNLARDWQNGMNHKIRTSASFTVLNYLNLTPSFNFQDRMYLQRYDRSWDENSQKEKVDTVQGFYNVYNWDMALQASTTLYGFFVPNRKLFGDKIQAIRHVFKPSVSFSYHPDFGAERYGYWGTYNKVDADGNVTQVEYNRYQGALYSPPSQGMAGNISMTLSNNVEMKVRSEDDSTGFKKISLIDELSASMSYNMAAKEKPWSDLNTTLRIKLTKSYTYSLNAVFATYAYEADSVGATPYVGNRTEYSKGRFGRFQGMSHTFDYKLNTEKIVKFFKKLRGIKDEKDKDKDKDKEKEDDDYDTGLDTNADKELEAGKHGAEKKSVTAETDEDGYKKFELPWDLRFSYGINMRENTSGNFNYETMRYPYKITQTLNMSGNVRLAEGWNINFSSGYDFENKKITTTTASLSRDLHCFNMSCQITLAPYTSYNFSFRCNAATLTDALKYDKRSSFSNAVQWY
ncbi:MAG: LPS-assembly protein LptD [Prevotella sp.]|nr:LPS-assembly protein LptD [Prevotella sp.]